MSRSVPGDARCPEYTVTDGKGIVYTHPMQMTNTHMLRKSQSSNDSCAEEKYSNGEIHFVLSCDLSCELSWLLAAPVVVD